MICCTNPFKYTLEIALKYPQSLKYREIINGNWIENECINDWIKKKYDKRWKKWIVYNDENPLDLDKTAKGHCKGVLSWNKKKVSWLIHSVPKFPEKLDKQGISGIDYSQLKFGQSFVYIEFDITHLNEVLQQVYLMNPNIYINSGGGVEATPASKLTNDYKIYPINENITHLAKSSAFEKDIYEEILIPEFGNSCMVESWLRGQVIPESDKVSHIKELNGLGNTMYESSADHSKFAISMDSKRKWVFIGDLNRMESQRKRGGGGLLVYDDLIHKAFMDIIVC